jgi:Carboxypeptidase regulatory-like domain
MAMDLGCSSRSSGLANSAPPVVAARRSRERRSCPRGQWCPRVLVLGLALWCAGMASAQPSGIIVRTVTDPTGAPLSAVTVAVTNTDTQASQTVATSATGDYSIPSVANGTYTVKAARLGFRAAVISVVVVAAARTVRADIRLQLGGVEQVVHVSATAATLQMDTVAVGTTIDAKAVNDLPLNGRTFAQLATLVPGVAPQLSINIATDRKRGSIGTSFAITANGFSDVQNNFIFDGVPAMDLDSYNFAFSPSIDAISEFRVQRR